MNRSVYELGVGMRSPLRDWPTRLHVDLPLLVCLGLLSAVGLMILYSAGGEQMDLLVRQGLRLGLAFLMMLTVAQIPSDWLHRIAPVLYGVGLHQLATRLIAPVMLTRGPEILAVTIRE